MKAQYILAFLISLSFAMTAQDREADSLILVDIYNSLDGPNWSNPENWLTDAPLEQWEGISTSQDRVKTLSIINQNPIGPFPVQAIQLSELATLEIRKGILTGEIPEELIELESLIRFSISDCGMSGEVPNIFTQFNNLKFLILENNQFEGTLPDIPNGLTLFYAQRNEFSGPIPDSWSNITLGNVNLSDNQLTGTMEIFETWQTISTINLSDNNWDPGAIPMWIDNAENINSFICKNCNLQGGLPAGFDLSDNSVHEQIILDGNNLGGDIAALFIGPNSMKKLYLSVRGNKFSGNFPAHLIHSASSVDIRSNNFASLTAFPEDVAFDGRFSTEYNKLNYEALEPVKKHIELDSALEVRYGNMQETLSLDTIVITEPTTLTILAGDLHPNTTYEWSGPTIQGLTESMVNIVIDEFSNGGTYQCFMANETYPNLLLRRNKLVVMTDFSTSTADEDVQIFKTFPNPTQDYISLDLSDNTKSGKYKLMRNDGRVIKSGSLDGSQKIDLQDLEAGTYYILLKVESQIQSQTIIKL